MERMEKQTAVDWLENRFLQTEGNLYAEDFTKAKEMEKEQERMYSEEEVMDMFHELSMHLPLHYEFLVREMFKKK
jgi:hypothetical protein